MIIRLQFAFFLARPVVDRVDLMLRLKQAMGDMLDGEPTLLPSTYGAPADFPFLTMGSRDGRCLISASTDRLDCIMSERGEAEERFVALARNALADLREVMAGFELSRFGCTATLFEPDEQPAKRVLGEYMRYDASETCNEAVFRVNEPRELGGALYNRVLVVQNGFKEDAAKGSVPGVITTVDINTAPDLARIDAGHIDAVLEQVEGDELVRGGRGRTSL